ncbi:MAG: type II toxin-antitoxin system prevent-host-death family antitoxin [Lachnospiraceae bacterium]|nr:type II toxin-antitoxin system prevent-host-death family antitoxin [Lachnospiraceae bacterium]MBQ6241928.1 type II toxin-antitoxin system prevent-host-death family antitoxin [Lachnospiraceae bacterium]
MPKIIPVSDLRNYGAVLEEVSYGQPVYLTRNGRGAYSLRDIQDEERFQKADAMIRLFCELNAGIRSAEEEGWISEEDLLAGMENWRKGD